MDLRDDNGPINVQWPTGLLRRALLESGRRLQARGQLHEPGHAIELTLDEVLGGLRGTIEVQADDISARTAQRAADSAITPPSSLGAPGPEPDLSVFPPALAAMTDMARTATSLLERAPSTRPD